MGMFECEYFLYLYCPLCMTVVSVRLCFDIETLFYDLQVMCTIFVRTRERENKTKGLYQTNLLDM